MKFAEKVICSLGLWCRAYMFCNVSHIMFGYRLKIKKNLRVKNANGKRVIQDEMSIETNISLNALEITK